MTVVAAIVQCTHSDLGKSRDPNDYVVSVLKADPRYDRILLAMPDIPANATLAAQAERWGVASFRGSEFNVAERLLAAAESVGADVIVRVLLKRFYLDSELVHRMVATLVREDADYVVLPRDFNYELAADVLHVRALRRAVSELKGDSFDVAARRFAPWRYIEEHPDTFRVVEETDLPVYSPARVSEIKSHLRALALGENQGIYGDGFPASRYRFIAPFLDPSSRVLDMACGQGEGAAFLAERCREVVGVDYSEAYVARARGRYSSPNLRFEAGDAHSFSTGAPFDAVVSMHTMEHLKDDRAFLANVRANLRPGGTFILEVPLLMPRPLGEPLWPFHEREYRVPELRGLLAAAGFRIDRVFGGDRGAYVEPAEAREVIQMHCTAVNQERSP